MKEYSHAIQFQGYLDPNPFNKAQNNPSSNKEEKHNALTKPHQNLVLNSSPMSLFHHVSKKKKSSTTTLIRLHPSFKAILSSHLDK
jgi:hypothetical protein